MAAESRLHSETVLRISRLMVLVGACAGVVACSSDSRNEPPPAEMCRQLVQACADLDTPLTDDCHDVGERGLEESKHQDQCFVFYDGCIDECRFRANWVPTEMDAASDSAVEDAAVTASASDAGLTDAGNPGAATTDAAN